MEPKIAGWAALGLAVCLADLSGASPIGLDRVERLGGESGPRTGTWAPDASGQEATHVAMPPAATTLPALEVEMAIEEELLLKNNGNPVRDLSGQ